MTKVQQEAIEHKQLHAEYSQFWPYKPMTNM